MTLCSARASGREKPPKRCTRPRHTATATMMAAIRTKPATDRPRRLGSCDSCRSSGTAGILLRLGRSRYLGAAVRKRGIHGEISQEEPDPQSADSDGGCAIRPSERDTCGGDRGLYEPRDVQPVDAEYERCDREHRTGVPFQCPE